MQSSAARNSALFDPALGAITLAPGAVDLVRGQAEEEEVLVARLLADLDVGAVERADRHRAVQHELHVAGAGGLLPAVEICSERSAAG